MRVLEIFSYNLKQLRFKDTKAYMERLLDEIGADYRGVAFDFRSDRDGAACGKIVRRFPNLSCYIHEDTDGTLGYCMNSDRGDSFYLDEAHGDDFDLLLQKIPRPVNFGFMSIVLDGVGSIGENRSCMTSFQLGITPKFDGDCILIKKDFDYGNKFNLVGIQCEIAVNGDSLAPRPDWVDRLTEKLGKPYGHDLVCEFDSDEKLKNEEAKAVFNNASDVERFDERFTDMLPERLVNMNYTDYDSLGLGPISGMSPGKTLTLYAKKYGFRYEKYDRGVYVMSKADSHGHIYTVELYIRPFTKHMDASFAARGYNFRHTLARFPMIHVNCESELEEYTKRVFEAVSESESECSALLCRLYGDTPIWYQQIMKENL